MKLTSLACTLVVVALAGTALAQPGDLPPPPPQPPPAPPAICVVVDASRDTLAEPERKAVASLVLQSFEAEKLPTTTAGNCGETYVISSVKLGNTINVSIAGPRGQRTGRSSSLDDLPNVYSQLVKSLVTGAPVATGGGAVDRTNVTKDQTAPRRVAADSLKYVQLGYGAVTSARIASGPSFGFGYRKELDRIGIDISLTFLLANDTDTSDGVTMSIPKLMFLWNQEPTADSTGYYGGGVSYGFAAVHTDGMTYTGSGLEGHLVGGYEMFRSSTIRGFVQLDLTLPFYKSDIDGGATRWPVSGSLTLGLGWGKTNVVRVINE
jgi:hypothetical protein